MAHIKCRYTIPYCNYRKERVYHDEGWWCDEDMNCKYTRPENSKYVNPQCVYCEYKTGEFEKSVKRYAYENGCLTLTGETYSEIDYLEIDGRVLVDKGR